MSVILPKPALLRTQPLILMPVPQHEWRDPSAAQFKDQFGNPGVQTRFRVTGRRHDRPVVRFWFDSRDDADFFLQSLVNYGLYDVPVPREDWRLPNEIWGDPELYPEFQCDFATVTFLTTPGSGTYNRPVDWNDSDNSIEALGGGASGAALRGQSNQTNGGGGGGEYRRIENFTLPSSVGYVVGDGGSSVIRTTNGRTNGNNGIQTTFNSASLVADNGDGGTSTGGAGGSGGTGAAGNADGGAGGSTSGSFTNASGGGGAGGPNGAGNSGVTANNISATAGGSGDSGSGGSGGSGSNVGGSTVANGGNGNPGTEWQASPARGSGGGGGGGRSDNGNSNGGDGGGYGAGGGAAGATGSVTSTSGAGAQGIIVVTYEPALAANIHPNRSAPF